MSTGIDRIQPADLEIPSSVSSTGLSMPAVAEVIVSAGVSSAAIPQIGDAEEAVSCGPGIAGLVLPRLSVFLLKAEGWEFDTRLFVSTTTTTGSDCTAQIELRETSGDVVATMPASSPEQSSPHESTLTGVTIELIGVLVDVFWRWSSGGETGVYEYIGQIEMPDDGDFNTLTEVP